MRICLLLLLIPIAAQSADEDGIRVGPVQLTYFVEPVETKINPSEDLSPQLAAASLKSGGAPTAITANGRTIISPPTVPTFHAEFETWVVPLSRQYQESILTGFAETKWLDGKTIIERFVRDNFRHIYVSYSMTVEALPAGTFRATFAESDAPAPSGLKVISMLNYPVPQLLEDGDTITLNLYTDGATGQKVVEDIHFGKQVKAILRKGAARDVYNVDDVNITQPRIRKNGIAQELNDAGVNLKGLAFWIYVPGEGRYVLSLKPHPELGFERAGEVVDNSLRFASHGNIFQVDCGDRIADAGSRTYNVYARRDSAWEPADSNDRTRFMIGSLTQAAESR